MVCASGLGLGRSGGVDGAVKFLAGDLGRWTGGFESRIVLQLTIMVTARGFFSPRLRPPHRDAPEQARSVRKVRCIVRASCCLSKT